MSITIPNNHQQCAVCSKPFFNNDHTLEFDLMADGGVIGKIVPTEKVQGYNGVMQGGAIAALHDAAMTHCLFAHDVCAMTAKLDVRFIKPISLNSLIEVKAHCIKSKRGIYFMQSRIFSDGLCVSKAEAKFM
ncbi:PaaI family thioesterase [Vibrio sp.]|uniref:PaaI family thioesterase n=1 Tax=Vibrio sp. TaxID=678 RepID=UPI003AA8BF34